MDEPVSCYEIPVIPSDEKENDARAAFRTCIRIAPVYLPDSTPGGRGRGCDRDDRAYRGTLGFPAFRRNRIRGSEDFDIIFT